MIDLVSVDKVEYSMGMTVEEFLKLKDTNLQKYIYLKNPVSDNTIIKTVESDEKLAFLVTRDTVKCNQVGAFYRKNILEQWIVYNKLTKKVKVSRQNSMVFERMLNHFFKESWLITKHIVHPTATFCKKVIEGKINNLEDVMKYHRSYSLRNKELDLNDVFAFSATSSLFIMPVISDPESLNYQTLDCLGNYVDPRIIGTRLFKVKLSEFHNINDMCDEWIREQDKNYVKIKRSRDGEVGNCDVEESAF